MKNIMFLLFISTCLIACSTRTKHKIGLVNPGPNEYAVTKNKPLEMPPHYNLELSEDKKYNTKDGNLNVAEKELLKEASKN